MITIQAEERLPHKVVSFYNFVKSGKMAETMVSFIKRAAEKTGYQRVKFVDNNLPTNSSNIIVFPFYGDIRHNFILSAFLLKRYKELKSSNYIIFCSWPGFEGLYPYVDEYWTIQDHAVLKSLALGAKGFLNQSDMNVIFTRKLNEWFENVISFKNDFSNFYNNGFQQGFWDNFGDLKLHLVDIPSETNIPESIRYQFSIKQGKKVFIYPTTTLRSWQRGQAELLSIDYGFWDYLCEKFLQHGFVPVIYQDYFTYDLSKTQNDKCIFFNSQNILQLLSIMRLTECVIDIYSGISRLAIEARCPYVCVDERERYIYEKDNEVDIVCCENIPHTYIFSFSSMTITGNKHTWDLGIINNLLNKIDVLTNNLNRDNWPSTKEIDIKIDYDKIKRYKTKRLGINYLKKPF